VKVPLASAAQKHLRAQGGRGERSRAASVAEVDAALAHAERDIASGDFARPLAAYLVDVCGFEPTDDAVANLLPTGLRLQHYAALRAELRLLARGAVRTASSPRAQVDSASAGRWAWAVVAAETSGSRGSAASAQVVGESAEWSERSAADEQPTLSPTQPSVTRTRLWFETGVELELQPSLHVQLLAGAVNLLARAWLRSRSTRPAALPAPADDGPAIVDATAPLLPAASAAAPTADQPPAVAAGRAGATDVPLAERLRQALAAVTRWTRASADRAIAEASRLCGREGWQRVLPGGRGWRGIPLAVLAVLLACTLAGRGGAPPGAARLGQIPRAWLDRAAPVQEVREAHIAPTPQVIEWIAACALPLSLGPELAALGVRAPGDVLWMTALDVEGLQLLRIDARKWDRALALLRGADEHKSAASIPGGGSSSAGHASDDRGAPSE